jgi:hypothetical protein
LDEANRGHPRNLQLDETLCALSSVRLGEAGDVGVGFKAVVNSMAVELGPGLFGVGAAGFV